MQVERVEVVVPPGFSENCYVVSDEKDAKSVVVVDPGAQAETILEALNGRTIERIILTHRHYDHIGALYELVQQTGAEVFAHTLDAEAISKLSEVGPYAKLNSLRPTDVDRTVEDGDRISVGTRELLVIHTPGHTIGSICLFDEKDHVLLSGDTLFYRAVGRTDFPTGDATQQHESLMKLAQLPEDTTVYPGHDEATSIGFEKQSGSLLRFK